VRFLLDNNLSPRLVPGLAAAGHDAIHVRDVGLGAAADEVVLAAARRDERVLISADTDFGTLLAHSRAAEPSMILLRRETGRRPAEQLQVLLDNLEQVSADLEQGSIVVITDRKIRIRRLPLLD
jgi:predicted nuclease of predicted toxin-antitoxin system